MEANLEGAPASRALARRRALLAEIDRRGLIATPGNSRYNELVIEAARLSILARGRLASIAYDERYEVRLARWWLLDQGHAAAEGKAHTPATHSAG